MTSCTVTNSSAISCDNGCCGTADNRTCCEFTLSESVIIVICVVGALVVVAIVIALIICLTSKQKNRVTRIRPQQRRNMLENDSRTRRVEFPKPPPYSEAPPQYDVIHFSEESRSTEPILPVYRTANARAARGNRATRRQNPPSERRSTNQGQQNDAPPSYLSVFHTETNNDLRDRHDSPEPGTSGMSRLSGNDTVVSLMDRTRHGSPHPSLASGRISTSMFNRQGTLHKTASERSRRQFGIGGNNSVTPVTIREITVHSPTQSPNIGNHSGERHDQNKRNKTFNSKIPRPSKRNTIETELQSNKHPTSHTSRPTELRPDAFEEENVLLRLGESPPPINQLAIARSAQRHTILHRLQQRKFVSPTPVQ